MPRSRLISAALSFWPPEFRDQFGEEIHEDAFRRKNVPLIAFELALRGVGAWGEGITRDVTFAVRGLRKNPLFATATIITFAVAISVNTVVFGAINAVLLQPLPFSQAESLGFICPSTRAQLWCNMSGPGMGQTILSINPVVGEGSFFGTLPAAVVESGRPQSIVAARVSSNFFHVMQVEPELGRLFTAADAQTGVRNVILSDRLWRALSGAGEGRLGQTILVNGIRARIVGAVPATFVMPSVDDLSLKPQTTDVFLALPAHESASDRSFSNSATAAAFTSRILIRIHRGTSLVAAQHEVDRVYAPILRGPPRLSEQERIVPFTDWYFNQSNVRLMLGLALVAALIVLIIACANVANLLLVRGTARRDEMALRSALGGTRAGIARQLLVEIGVLSVAGGALGVALAFVQIRLVMALFPALLPRMSGITIDSRVFLLTCVAIAAATFIAGVLPAAMTSAQAQAAGLGNAGRGRDPAAGRILRLILVVVEIALAFIVVVSTGLLLRSLNTVTQSATALDPAGVYMADINLLPERYKQPTVRSAFSSDLLGRIRRIPGIESVAASQGSPYFPNGANMPAVTLPAKILNPAGRKFFRFGALMSTTVSPEYFRLFRIPIVRGRAFTASDAEHSTPVVILGEPIVRPMLRNTSVVGQTVTLFGEVPTEYGGASRTVSQITATIVGVARAAEGEYRSPTDTVFVPASQFPPNVLELSMRIRTDDPHLREEIAAAVTSLDPSVSVYDFTSLDDVVSETTAPQRTSATLLGLMAIVALVLALVGIYATVSYTVSRRTHEFGIRKALGAQSGDILRQVLFGASGYAVAGIAAGIVLAGFVARPLGTILEQTHTSVLDPGSFAAAVCLLLVSTLLAAAVPASRAMKVDPAVAIRFE